MSDMIKIAVDAMGGDGSPKKIIDGIKLNHQSNKDIFPLIKGSILFFSPKILKKLFLFLE